MKPHPNTKVNIKEINTEMFNHIKNCIESLHSQGFLSGLNYNKINQIYNKWLLQYGLKYQIVDNDTKKDDSEEK